MEQISGKKISRTCTPQTTINKQNSIKPLKIKAVFTFLGYAQFFVDSERAFTYTKHVGRFINK